MCTVMTNAFASTLNFSGKKNGSGETNANKNAFDQTLLWKNAMKSK